MALKCSSEWKSHISLTLNQKLVVSAEELMLLNCGVGEDS